jgi:hypothetical protein
MRTRLEQVGAAFLGGYHSALEFPVGELAGVLHGVDEELRGFAFEGAAMGLALLDWLTPWRASRLSQFLRGAGEVHTYMVHVGVGWLWARLPGLRPGKRCLNPLLSWLAFDGWGFHEGFFHWPSYIDGQPVPRRLKGYERRVFDQGLGRSFWFVNGGDPALIAATINKFSTERRGDLWSGVGLAATYAGCLDEPVLRQLRQFAGDFQPQLAQGCAFAAKARQRAGNLTEYTELATRMLANMNVHNAACLCDTTLENLPSSGPIAPYEVWRQRLQDHFRLENNVAAHTQTLGSFTASTHLLSPYPKVVADGVPAS